MTSKEKSPTSRTIMCPGCVRLSAAALTGASAIIPFIIAAAFSLLAARPAAGMQYVGTAPGAATSEKHSNRLALQNEAIRCELDIESGKAAAWSITNRQTRQRMVLTSGHTPKIMLAGGQTVDLSAMKPTNGFDCIEVKAEAGQSRGESACGGRGIAASFKEPTSGLRIDWSVELRDGSNYVVQTLTLSARKDIRIDSLVFMDAAIKGARQVGQVDGSVVVADDIFMAVEHPLAVNSVEPGDPLPRVRCSLPRGNTLKAGQTWRYSSVIGVVPANQLRRGFLYYLERRRAHPYRPFLHYNSWYDLNIGRPDNRMTEAECLKAIEFFGRELIRGRGVKLDAFVWDDGWDDFNSLWGFHNGFPEGFKKLKDAAARYAAAMGVWTSPWGGYGGPKNKRIAFGKSQGYETNANGYSMAGAKYGKAFRDVCLNMMREQGVIFFKFDGMGTGNETTGAKDALADDIDAVLALTRALRRENPEVFISATVGTWASPFWTFYADSIWRQGGDTGYHGEGDTRQQWITYRDKCCHDRIVQLGPLYPLNSLMLHGPCIGERANPSRMVRNDKSVADEFWSFFGSGTNLQELYITPHLLTGKMWDELAEAAKWSRANSDVLADTHWIGGSPGKAEVYGWASWRPDKGILTLRNPSDKPREFSITPKAALELPEGIQGAMKLTAIYPHGRQIPAGALGIGQPIVLTLQPFEVVVMELLKAD